MKKKHVVNVLIFLIFIALSRIYGYSSVDSAASVFYSNRDKILSRYETFKENDLYPDVIFIDDSSRVIDCEGFGPKYFGVISIEQYEIIKDSIYNKHKNRLSIYHKNKKILDTIKNKNFNYWKKNMNSAYYIIKKVVKYNYREYRYGNCVSRFSINDYEMFDIYLSMFEAFFYGDLKANDPPYIRFFINAVIDDMPYEYIKTRSNRIKKLLKTIYPLLHLERALKAYALCELSSKEKKRIRQLEVYKLFDKDSKVAVLSEHNKYQNWKDSYKYTRGSFLRKAISKYRPEIKDVKGSEYYKKYLREGEIRYDLNDLIKEYPGLLKSNLALELYSRSLYIWILYRAGVKGAEDNLIWRYDNSLSIDMEKNIQHFKEKYKIESIEDFDNDKKMEKLGNPSLPDEDPDSGFSPLQQDLKHHLKNDRYGKNTRPFLESLILDISKSQSRKAVCYMLKDFKSHRQTYTDKRLEALKISTRIHVLKAMSRYHPNSEYFNVELGEILFRNIGSAKFDSVEEVKEYRRKILNACECCRFKSTREYLEGVAGYFKREWEIEYKDEEFGDYIITEPLMNKKEYKKASLVGYRGPTF